MPQPMMRGPDRDEVLAALTGRFADFYGQYAPLRPNGGELRGPCPLHGGQSPNFAVNPATGRWFCHSGCQGGGDVFSFIERREGTSFPEALARVAAFAGVSAGAFSAPLPMPARAAPHRTVAIQPAPPAVKWLDPAIAEELHSRLMDCASMRLWLSEQRGLTTETLTRFRLGMCQEETPHGKIYRITFPVFDREGRLTNIRKHLFGYRRGVTEGVRRDLGKTLPWGKGLRADLFPLAALDGAREALILEGEADAALACQMGFAAVTGTLGAGNWKEHWTDELRGLARVTILYDDDQPGRDGARKVAAALAPVVADVRIARYGARLTDPGLHDGRKRHSYD